MIKTIVIVTLGEQEFDWCRQQLQPHNPSAAFVPVYDDDTLSRLTFCQLATGRIIAFCTGVIVPARILDQTSFGAYNFHPGSPAYPGWFPSCFAMYDGATEFGATAHAMAPKVDSGAIIATSLFPVTPDMSLNTLDERACMCAGQLLMHMAQDLAAYPLPLKPLGTEWGPHRSTRKTFAALCEISPDMTAAEKERRVKAVGADRIRFVDKLAMPELAAPRALPEPRMPFRAIA